MILAHKIRLYPNKQQKVELEKATGVARFTYNWALDKYNTIRKQGGKPNLGVLKKEFNALKRKEFPWIMESPKDANQQPFNDLSIAFVRFFKKISKYPRFKSKKRNKQSFYVSNDKFNINETTIKLPVIGDMRLAEPLRFKGKILSARITKTASYWFISIQVDTVVETNYKKCNNVIGIDLGVATQATLSTGEKIVKPLNTNINKLQQNVSRKQKGSKNRDKAILRLQRKSYENTNRQQDFLHKLTTRLCRENQTIVIEDLNVKGMLKNHKLAKAIQACSFYEFRRQLEYKGKIYNCNVVTTDKWFPSTKTCSHCGNKQDIKLAERTYHCSNCGLVIDRDINAAMNLKQLGMANPKVTPVNIVPLHFALENASMVAEAGI